MTHCLRIKWKNRISLRKKSMCNYKDETKKKTREKQRVEKKKNTKSDLIVIEDDSLKQKQKKTKY